MTTSMISNHFMVKISALLLYMFVFFCVCFHRHPRQLDFKKCIICQEEKSEKIVCPANNPVGVLTNPYVEFIKAIDMHKSILPFGHDFNADILYINNAGWHRSCRRKFTNNNKRNKNSKRNMVRRLKKKCNRD